MTPVLNILRHFRALALTLTVMMLASLPGPARAQEGMASLVADSIQVLGTDGLVAEGNVVVIFEGARLTASRVSFNQSTGLLSIDGPISLTEAGGTIFLADAAELSSDLRNGILQSARLVLNQQLQIAADQINRVSGRYTQMTRVIASSCMVCGHRPVPLWAIRASQVVHDQETRQLYFYNAQLRLMDIPIFYLPRLRLPDPTVTRYTGFLIPRFRSNSRIGTGLRVPYFITMGDHADLTIAPFISEVTRTLELRYRQAFRFGNVTFEGAVSQDNIQPGITRYYLFGEGTFNLPRDFKLNFNIEKTSDTDYLSDYGFAGRDRLRNDLVLTRTRRNQYIFAEVADWQTLRPSEIPIADQLPAAQANFLIEQRFHPALIGGELRLSFSGEGHVRNSTLDVLGRDQARVGAGLEWQRNWIFENGLVASAETAFTADFFRIEDDAAFLPEQTRLTGSAAVTLAFPMSRQSARGATDILEPMVQLAWTGQQGPDAPNDDSLMVEFDSANLFDLSRFPGRDAIETGLRATIGATWTHINPNGLSFTLAGGKVFRLNDLGQYSVASGLDGTQSDWLVAGQLNLSDHFFVQSRTLIADDFTVTKSETQAGYQNDKLAIAAGYLWVQAAPGPAPSGENRPDPIHEWTLETSYRFNDNWAASFDTNFDGVAGIPTLAKIGLEFRTECITVDLSLSRRFNSSGNVPTRTDIGFGIELTGFGGSTSRRASGCSPT